MIQIYKEEVVINIRNKTSLWTRKKLRIFYEEVQLNFEGNTVQLSYVPWKKLTLTKRD